MIPGSRARMKATGFIGRVHLVEQRVVDDKTVTRVLLVGDRGPGARIWVGVTELEQIDGDGNVIAAGDSPADGEVNQ